jgi:hypothetical protein
VSGVLRPYLSVSEVGPKRVANLGLILEVRTQKGSQSPQPLMGKFAADRVWTRTSGERSDGAWGFDHLYHLDLDEKSHGVGNSPPKSTLRPISRYSLPGRALEHRLHAGLSEMEDLTQRARFSSGRLRRYSHSSEQLLTISRRAGRAVR